MRVIALTGPKGVGKTSIAEAIAAKHDNAKVVSFATELKQMVVDTVPGIPCVEFLEQLKRSAVRVNGKTGLEHIWDTSNIAKRDHGDRVFLDKTIDAVEAHRVETDGDPELLVIFDDLRSMDEVEYIGSLQGDIVRVSSAEDVDTWDHADNKYELSAKTIVPDYVLVNKKGVTDLTEMSLFSIDEL